jgi:hypothetical protein
MNTVYIRQNNILTKIQFHAGGMSSVWKRNLLNKSLGGLYCEQPSELSREMIGHYKDKGAHISQRGEYITDPKQWEYGS